MMESAAAAEKNLAQSSVGSTRRTKETCLLSHCLPDHRKYYLVEDKKAHCWTRNWYSLWIRSRLISMLQIKPQEDLVSRHELKLLCLLLRKHPKHSSKLPANHLEVITNRFRLKISFNFFFSFPSLRKFHLITVNQICMLSLCFFGAFFVPQNWFVEIVKLTAEGTAAYPI